MTDIDHRFSSLGLLTYKFQLKFKKVLHFLEIMDDPELLFTITCFLNIQDLLALLSTCKKFYSLKQCPIIEVRILKQKIHFLESPKQPFNNLNLIPAYYQFLMHQKQEQKQIPKNSEVFYKNLSKYKQAREAINKRKQMVSKTKSQVTKILQSQKAYEGIVSKIQKQIQQESKIFYPVQLSKEPQKKSQPPKSYVQKFRQNYSKVKQFERKKNIQQLQNLHLKQSQKIKIKGQIQTPFKKIPVIQIKDDERINVVKVDNFNQTKVSRYLNRVKAILGLNVYY